jgi:transglutaminase/protease-like cytokinesis protein 3
MLAALAKQNPKPGKERVETFSREGHGMGTSVESRGTSLYSEISFRELAEHARQTPDNYAQSVPELTKYLVKMARTPEQKAWVIFGWVCYHVCYDVDGLHGRAPRQSSAPDDVLKSRLSVCAGYAGIFEALAAHAGLIVKQVSGHARNCSRRVGQDVIKNGVGAHAWNAVKLGNDWILIDCTWGAGTCTNTTFEATFRPHFFGVPPNQLAFTHFPSETSWQLLEQPITYFEFINQPIVCTDVLFGHNIRFIQSSPRGVIILKGSNVGSVELDVPEDVFVMGRFGDLKTDVCRSSARCVILRFSMADVAKTATDLEIFVRRGGLCGTYGFACKFAVECH